MTMDQWWCGLFLADYSIISVTTEDSFF